MNRISGRNPGLTLTLLRTSLSKGPEALTETSFNYTGHQRTHDREVLLHTLAKVARLVSSGMRELVR